MVGATSRGGDNNTSNYTERVLTKGSIGQRINKRLTADAI